jgi:hypothetical protein
VAVLCCSLRQHGDAQCALAGAPVDDACCTARSRVLRLPCAPVPVSP